MIRVVTWFLTICSLLLNTPLEEFTPQSRIVTQVEVTASISGESRVFTYTDPEKMEILLNYLRLLKPDVRHPLTPETFRSDVYELRLIMLDGSKNSYYQLYDTYLRKNDSPWYAISSVDGSMLHPLLLSMPPDTQ